MSYIIYKNDEDLYVRNSETNKSSIIRSNEIDCDVRVDKSVKYVICHTSWPPKDVIDFKEPVFVSLEAVIENKRLICAYNSLEDNSIEALKNYGITEIPTDARYYFASTMVLYDYEGNLNYKYIAEPIILILENNELFMKVNFGDKDELHKLKTKWVGNHKYMHYTKTDNYVVWYISDKKDISADDALHRNIYTTDLDQESGSWLEEIFGF